MPQRDRTPAPSPLFSQLAWFARLRWLAGGAVIAGALINRQWLGWYAGPAGTWALAAGAAVLLYNVAVILVLRRAARSAAPRRKPVLFTLAWLQIIADLGCLTLLTLWTGGLSSPLRGFFVFHMVFASLLLPRYMAYGGAILAVVMFTAGLWLNAGWPADHEGALALASWVVLLLLTVHLTNHTTRSLRRKRRRLARQNRRIRAMSERIRRQQEAMIQHEKMVALGQMAAGVAHEIANPLASMDSLLQLMERRPEKLRPDALATLREQVARIHQIVRQMTAFAHPSEGDRQTLPVNQVVEGALEMIRFDPRLKRVALARDLAEQAGTASLQPQAVQQVIINLVINALDAVEEAAQPRVRVQTAREGDQCVVRVTDNGHGIAAENLKRIFEPFFTTKPVGKGTGLGLSISYNLVQRQGGEIQVQSKVGEGTTFTLRLPMGAGASWPRESAATGLPNSGNPQA